MDEHDLIWPRRHEETNLVVFLVWSHLADGADCILKSAGFTDSPEGPGKTEQLTGPGAFDAKLTR